MTSLKQVATSASLSGAATRIVAAFTLYFASVLIIGLALSQIQTPDILTLLPNQIPAVCGLVVVIVVFTNTLDVGPATYGLDIDRRWASDMLGGAVIGVVYQAAVTAAILSIGAGTIVDRWSMGVFADTGSVIIAIGTTAIAFFIVALGEDFLFRGVLIREFVVGLTARQTSQMNATTIAVVGSALLFGSLHLNAGAAGLSTGVVVLQAVVGGLYFGIAYVLTDSLALPVGIHFSTNLWTTVVFGQPGSGYPTAFRITRQIDLGVDIILLLFVPVGILVGGVVLWVRATRGEVPKPSLTMPA